MLIFMKISTVPKVQGAGEALHGKREEAGVNSRNVKRNRIRGNNTTDFNVSVS